MIEAGQEPPALCSRRWACDTARERVSRRRPEGGASKLAPYDHSLQARYERAILPHLDAAFNLARWLTRSEQDAEDVVQEACLRAFRSFDGFHSADARGWLLAIVRNTSYTWLSRNRGRDSAAPLDGEALDVPSDVPGPEASLLRRADAEMVREAIEELPAAFREVLVLRELEDLSYKQVAAIAGIPIGTVMSRLARARQKLGQCLARRCGGGDPL